MIDFGRRPGASLALACLLYCSAVPAATPAGPPRERVGAVATLPASPGPHWMWVYDANLSSMPDGRAILVDGDAGNVLGMVSTGYSFVSFTLPRDYRSLFSAETYYSRTTRGMRTDVLSIYDPQTLAPRTEIVLPTKRASTIPRAADSAITDDDRFLAVFNLTPASSLSIVDTAAEKFVGEIETPGCAMAYAAGRRTLFSLCSDGSVVASHLTDEGTLRGRDRLPGFFTLEDPIIEAGVRSGDTWRFISFGGNVYTLVANESSLTAGERWPLFSAAARKQGWQSGGMLPTALHVASGRLHVLTYRGATRNHKLPGTEVWTFDVATHARVARIKLPTPVRAIQVTQDDDPLLFALSDTTADLYAFDARTGALKKTIPQIGITPILMQSPWVRP